MPLLGSLGSILKRSHVILRQSLFSFLVLTVVLKKKREMGETERETSKWMKFLTEVIQHVIRLRKNYLYHANHPYFSSGHKKMYTSLSKLQSYKVFFLISLEAYGIKNYQTAQLSFLYSSYSSTQIRFFFTNSKQKNQLHSNCQQVKSTVTFFWSNIKMKYTNELQHIVKLANDVLKIYPTFLGDWVFSTFQVIVYILHHFSHICVFINMYFFSLFLSIGDSAVVEGGLDSIKGVGSILLWKFLLRFFSAIFLQAVMT